MTVVRTVGGDISPDALGVTATHEHVWCDQRMCRGVAFPQRSDPMVLQDADVIVAELEDFKAAGGQAMVDATVRGWGRDVGALKQISQRTDLHIIATSGYYVEDCLPSFVWEMDVPELEELLVQEVTAGADESAIRTGLLKSAVGRRLLEGPEEKCARAVARAHLRTGATITTHTSASARFHIPGGNAGMMHLDLFESEGVDPTRVIIGHCDENADIRQLRTLAARGAYVQFDVIGKLHWLLDETRVDLLAAMVDAGYSDRLLLSSDRARYSELKVGGGPGYDHVLRDFVPRLRRRDFDDALLRQILITNAANALSFDPLQHI